MIAACCILAVSMTARIVALKRGILITASFAAALGFIVSLLGPYPVSLSAAHQDMAGSMNIAQCQSACSPQSTVIYAKDEARAGIKLPKPKPDPYYVPAAAGFVYLGTVITKAHELRRLNQRPPDILNLFSISRR